MDFKAIAIDRFTKWLIGGELFDSIKETVEELFDVDISGEEKRKIAFDSAKEMFSGVANVLVNIGIEMAVLYFNSKTTTSS